MGTRRRFASREPHVTQNPISNLFPSLICFHSYFSIKKHLVFFPFLYFNSSQFLPLHYFLLFAISLADALSQIEHHIVFFYLQDRQFFKTAQQYLQILLQVGRYIAFKMCRFSVPRIYLPTSNIMPLSRLQNMSLLSISIFEDEQLTRQAIITIISLNVQEAGITNSHDQLHFQTPLDFFFH